MSGDPTNRRLMTRHETRYRYASPVAASYNEARLTPQTTLSQTTVDARIEVEPHAHVTRYWDYWGTLVHAFDVQGNHTEMVVTGISTVERSNGLDTPLPDVGWDVLDGGDVHDNYCEYLAPSAWVPTDPELDRIGSGLRRSQATPREVLGTAVEWVRSQLDYERGTTTVSTSAVEAWRNGRGVCQDFVHLTLAVLRAAGVPARYVSGYLHPDPNAAVGVTATGESHAWVEGWFGDWHGIDPTNLLEIAERHVLVARGRDYGDVPPLKGIFSGGATQLSEVKVEITRLV